MTPDRLRLIRIGLLISLLAVSLVLYAAADGQLWSGASLALLILLSLVMIACLVFG
jgi:hypothetical protein